MGNVTPDQRNIEEYVSILAGKNYPQHTIITYLHGIMHYCSIEDVPINWKRIKKFTPRRTPFRKTRGYTDNEVKSMLSASKTYDDVAVIRLLCESGVRIGAWNNMTLDGQDVIVYPDDIEEYRSFISKTTAEILTQQTLDLSMNTIRSRIARLRRRAGCITGQTQCNHAFRKRFNTILKMDNTVNVNIAEKLMGHKNGLDGVYFTPSRDQLFSEWCKVSGRLVPE